MSAACPNCETELVPSTVPSLGAWCPAEGCGYRDGRSEVTHTNGNGAGPLTAVITEVDGAELLDNVAAFIGRFQVLPSQEVSHLLALWVLHTHSFEAAWATPYLRITSAAPESGKTQLLEILATLVRRGWHAVNPSVAVLYRKIDRQTPTLLLDEMDNYPRRRAAGRAVGAERRLQARRHDRSCRENGDLESFSAYCPKAYAGLDKHQIVDTLLSRSITIRLEKRLPTESGRDVDRAAHRAPGRAAARTVRGVGGAEHGRALRGRARTAAGDDQPRRRGLVGAARHRRPRRRGLAGASAERRRSALDRRRRLETTVAIRCSCWLTCPRAFVERDTRSLPPSCSRP